MELHQCQQILHWRNVLYFITTLLDIWTFWTGRRLSSKPHLLFFHFPFELCHLGDLPLLTNHVPFRYNGGLITLCCSKGSWALWRFCGIPKIWIVKAGRLLWSANSTALHGRLCQLMSVLLSWFLVFRLKLSKDDWRRCVCAQIQGSISKHSKRSCVILTHSDLIRFARRLSFQPFHAFPESGDTSLSLFASAMLTLSLSSLGQETHAHNLNWTVVLEFRHV